MKYDGRRTPWTLKALELLADGEWHSYREVISKMAATVPPGMATRRAERSRREVAQRKGYRSVTTRIRPKEAADVVRVGQLIIARQTLNNGRKFEIEPKGANGYHPDRRVRLRPGAPK